MGLKSINEKDIAYIKETVEEILEILKEDNARHDTDMNNIRYLTKRFATSKDSDVVVWSDLQNESVKNLTKWDVTSKQNATKMTKKLKRVKKIIGG